MKSIFARLAATVPDPQTPEEAEFLLGQLAQAFVHAPGTGPDGASADGDGGWPPGA